jgi:hypothetical protein
VVRLGGILSHHEFMGRLIALLFFADLALLVVALIDSLSTDRHEIRKLPKVFWVVLILLVSPFGPILWFLYGRPKKVKVAATAESRRRSRRAVAPDDDPDFLRKLNPPPRRDVPAPDEDLIKRFEEDLRRRDDDPPDDAAGR